MENDNLEVVVENKSKKKILISILFCMIIVILLFMFLSNNVSKSKIKIEQIAICVISSKSSDNFFTGGYKTNKFGGILVGNENECAVDIEIKGDFYDKDGNWLGEQIYKQTIAPNTKDVLSTWWDIMEEHWFKHAEKEKYTLIKCKKSAKKLLDVGFTPDNDITVVMNKGNDEITYINNTNRDIKADIALKEIRYIENDYIYHTYVLNIENELIPANEKISVHNYYGNDDIFQEIMGESVDKTETFLYAYEVEN